jgi:DNA topoisomerase-1
VLAAVELAAARPAGSKRSTEGSIREAVKRVAEHLGNTPAVARRSYIDPCVIDRFRDGEQIDLPEATSLPLGPRQRARIERQVLALLDD